MYGRAIIAVGRPAVVVPWKGEDRQLLVQKTVQTKNDENERDQISCDGGGDVHEVLLLGVSSLGDDAGLIKTKARTARVKLCSIAVADVAKKVRLPR